MKDQQRTKIKKKIFLNYFKKSFGIITVGCEKAQIERCTYYNWLKEDEKFAEKIRQVESQRNDYVEDRLFKKINQDDASCIKFYLEKRHNNYKPVNRIEITGEITLEDLLKKDDDKIKKEQEEYDKKYRQNSTSPGTA